MVFEPRTKLVEVLDSAQEYLDLAIKSKDRGEREFLSASWSCTWRSPRSLRRRREGNCAAELLWFVTTGAPGTISALSPC